MYRRVVNSPVSSLIVASFVTFSGGLMADGGLGEGILGGAPADAFQLDARRLDPIRFSRLEQEGEPVLPASATRLTRFSLKVKPADKDPSRRGLYGLGADSQPLIAIEGGTLGRHRVYESVPDLHNGFAYSAGVNLEHEEAVIDSTAYVSSSLLGVSYGRLGRLWYGGVDVNLEQFSGDDIDGVHSDMVSLDVTGGRRLGWTGLSSASPLWLLSLQGNFDVQELEDDELDVNPDWFLNPSLFWRNPDFTFSAQVQVPVQFESVEEAEEPDYRLRAVFEKKF